MNHLKGIGDCIEGFGGQLRDKENLEDLGVSGKIILERIFKKLDGEWIGFLWFRIGTGGGGI
jgi:hypothetical protein